MSASVITEESAGCKVLVGRDELNNAYRPPENLSSSDIHLFPPGMNYTVPQQKVLVFEDAEVVGRGPIRHRGEYVMESFVVPSHYDRWLRKRGHWRAAAERLVSPVKRFDDRAIWITDNWSCGYFHWICDALPRLELALQHYSASDATLILPYKYRKSRYFLQSLKAFGMTKVRFLKRFERLCCRELVIPQHTVMTGNHDPELVKRIRDRFRNHVGATNSHQQGKRIYISREVAKYRRIANEDEVMGLLNRFGFEKIVAEKLSWDDQMAVMASSELIVSIHGSGLANMMAMPASGKVVEIRESTDNYRHCFWTMASSLDLPYYYLLADKVNPRESEHTADLHVDIDQLAHVIQEASSHRKVA